MGDIVNSKSDNSSVQLATEECEKPKTFRPQNDRLVKSLNIGCLIQTVFIVIPSTDEQLTRYYLRLIK